MHVLAVSIGGWDITAQYVFRGFIEGLTYGMVALGLVLIYKASGVINFAQGQFGAFGALLMTIINFNYGIPIGVGLVLAILCGAALGGITELLVVRALSAACFTAAALPIITPCIRWQPDMPNASTINLFDVKSALPSGR